MTTRAHHAPVLLIAIVPMLFGCSLFKGKSESAKVEGCPESTEEVSRLDWGLEDPESIDLRAGLMASIHIDQLAGAMNEELIDACGSLAKQLYADEKALTPEATMMGAEADQACKVVDESIAKLKGIAGGRVVISAGVPLCSTPVKAADACFSACRTAEEKKKGPPPLPKLECEGETSGTCKGSCSGTCTQEGESDCAGSCAGLCDGSCDSEFTGTCRGTCEGRCDGEESSGECQGTCQGRCLEAARGTCGGTCIGSCDGACTIQAAGTCGGICAGECDKPLTDKRCTGYLRLPSDLNDCQEGCDALVLGKMTCTPPVVKVKVEEPENEEAANLLERSLSQHLPKILAARALNLEQARVTEAEQKAKAAIEKLTALEKKPELELEEKDKVCIDQKVQNEKDAAQALSILFSAATTARMATVGE